MPMWKMLFISAPSVKTGVRRATGFLITNLITKSKCAKAYRIMRQTKVKTRERSRAGKKIQ